MPPHEYADQIQFVSELLLHDAVGAFFGAVSGANQINAGLFDFMCQKAYLTFGLVEKVRPADQGVNALVGKGGADFADNIDRTALGAAVEYDKSLFRFEDKALFV